MIRTRKWMVSLGGAMAAAGFVLGVSTVWELERAELESIGEPTRLTGVDGEPHRELGRAELHRGEDVVFEVCAEDALDPAHWAGHLELVVWNVDDEEVVMHAALDRALLERASRSSQGTCILLAEGRDLPIAGAYAIEAVWPGRTLPAEVEAVPLVARFLSHRPLRASDAWPVWLVLGGSLVVLLGVARAPAEPGAASASRPLHALGGGLSAFALVLFALAWVPFGGATVALARGISIALVEIAAAFFFARMLAGPSVADALALGSPRPRWAMLVVPIFGAALWSIGGYVAQLIPATGEAPIETIVAWPSGSLAIALVALGAPLAEELFFRGLLYGALEERLGARGAFGATVLLFALVHLPQTWGAWGAFASILAASIGFTAIRSRTGSTLAAALAHLAHNAILAVGGLLHGIAA